ncbi:hypothetical protein KIPB_012893, partial [Kipferlia bialata]
ASAKYGTQFDANGSWMAIGSDYGAKETVYLYKVDSSTGLWALHTTLTAPDTLCADSACSNHSCYFGSAVSLSGDTLAVGAYRAWSFETSKTGGSVAIFDYSAGTDTWTYTHRLDSTQSMAMVSGFGLNVALSEGVSVILRIIFVCVRLNG